MILDKRATILVIDDTPANLSLLNQLLREHYRVKLANNGMKGLALAAASVPDLILLDIMMPEMDGYEVCRRLKADPATARTPSSGAKQPTRTRRLCWLSRRGTGCR